MRRFILIPFFALLLVACGTPTGGPPAVVPTAAPVAASADPCSPTDLQSYRAAYSELYNRWGVALIAAGKARPEELRTPIGQLQSISSELTTLKPPQCAKRANDETAQAMKQIIEGYESLLAGKDVGQMLAHGIDMLSVARSRVNALPEELAPTATQPPTNTPVATNTPTNTPEPTSTPTATPTPEPRSGVIDSRVVQVYDSPSSTTPIKTLVRGTKVLVFELAKGRLHVKADDIEGWVSQGAVIIQ
ncbi:MAG TPA: hypothetical protein VFO07_09500 [Roseiflexaceae bacterium]|nr:hypothetical protein [Roseiflexaceae bacterium]